MFAPAGKRARIVAAVVQTFLIQLPIRQRPVGGACGPGGFGFAPQRRRAIGIGNRLLPQRKFLHIIQQQRALTAKLGVAPGALKPGVPRQNVRAGPGLRAPPLHVPLKFLAQITLQPARRAETSRALLQPGEVLVQRIFAGGCGHYFFRRRPGMPQSQ